MAKREPKVSLELLGHLMEQMLERQRQVENRLIRVERAVLAGHRLLLDRTAAETEVQQRLDDITRRVEALEH